MKRQQYLGCLLASCVLILTACGTVQPISGQVVERTTEEDGTLSAFVVETHTGERISLTMTEKTRVFSWVDGVSGQDFAAGTLDGIAVSVVTGDPADLTAAGSTGLSAYEASEVQITQIRLAEEITLSDGTAVEIWQGSRDNRYKLADGTELLWEQRPVGPGRVHTAGQAISPSPPRRPFRPITIPWDCCTVHTMSWKMPTRPIWRADGIPASTPTWWDRRPAPAPAPTG